jgi:hypothetical protein
MTRLTLVPLVLAATLLAGCMVATDTCPTGMAQCDVACVDIRTDEANCGTCGNACASGQVCAGGSCEASCLAGQVLCGGRCVDPQSDRAFCGARADCAGPNDGDACASGQVCAGGSCEASCLAGQVLCGGRCVDPQSDRAFCGAQGDCEGPNDGDACASGQVCAGGSCEASCLAGQLLCGGRCVDPQSDRAFCGAQGDCEGPNDGDACASGEVCAGGSCQASCLAGQVLCGGRCVDPQSDRAFCGAQGDCEGPNDGDACASGQVCAGGSCQASCLAGQVLCGGRCVDPQSDRAFCGAQGDCDGPNDGDSCDSGEVCAGGSCQASCLAGQVLCGGRCVDPQSDRAFCGAQGDCEGPNDGDACASGEVCAGGSCQASCLAGQVLCGGRCVDPQSDRAFCGAQGDCAGPNDGDACASGQVCAGGSCQASCLAGQLLCGGRCVDPQSDRAFCGAQGDCAGPNDGNACASGQVCAGGSCQTTCLAGQVLCGGRCVEPQSDRAFCGAQADCAGPNDGATCSAREICSAGACVSNDATLAGLVISAGDLSPSWAPDTHLYVVSVMTYVSSVVFTPTAAAGAVASITLNGASVVSGRPSAPVTLSTGGLTYVTVRVVAPAGAEQTYRFIVVQGSPVSTYLKASNTDPIDRFGMNSISLFGDTLAVGVPFESSSATGVNADAAAQADNEAYRSGAVYVFVRTNGVWSQQAYIKASNTGAQDQFGFSVAVYGDTLAVGARREDSSATGVHGDSAAQADDEAFNAGAVYVFTRTGGVWSQQAYLKASNAGALDQFGFSVALERDTLAVGALFESSSATGVNGDAAAQADDSASNSGAAYVFTRTNGVWSQQAYLKASNTGSGDEFGSSIALSGDTLAVGAPAEDSARGGVNGDATAQADNSAVDSGAVYVFRRSNGAWTQEAYVKASNPGRLDDFGYSVALSGGTLAVGAPLESSSAAGVNGDAAAQADDSAAFAGAVYVFSRAGNTWSQEAYLKASNTDGNDRFGYSLALSNDALAVGARGESSSSTEVNGDQSNNDAFWSGAAYVFTRSGGGWTQHAYVKASNTGANDEFGSCIAMSGDVLAISANGEASSATGVNGDQGDDSAPASGAVYVWNPSRPDWD